MAVWILKIDHDVFEEYQTIGVFKSLDLALNYVKEQVIKISMDLEEEYQEYLEDFECEDDEVGKSAYEEYVKENTTIKIKTYQDALSEQQPDDFVERVKWLETKKGIECNGFVYMIEKIKYFSK